MRKGGIPVRPAPCPNNNWTLRREAIAVPLTALTMAGDPGLIVTPGTPRLRKGLNGGYCYKRVQVAGSERYHDKPDKNLHSHVCFVAGSLVDGRPIESLSVGDEVTTPIGPRKVVATGSRVAETVTLTLSDGRRIRCTPDHPFCTDSGYVRADAVKILLSCFERGYRPVQPKKVPPQQPEQSTTSTSLEASAITGSRLDTNKCHDAHAVQYLHVAVWEFHHGPVPEGCHIHHKDGDRGNNQLENLECLDASEHMSLHQEGRAEEARRHLVSAQEAAVQWRKDNPERASDLGRQAYEHVKDVWRMRPRLYAPCVVCGKWRDKENNGAARDYCGPKCQAAYRRQSGVDNIERTCQECGTTFTVNKYAKQRLCSRSCGGKVAARKRLQHHS